MWSHFSDFKTADFKIEINCTKLETYYQKRENKMERLEYAGYQFPIYISFNHNISISFHIFPPEPINKDIQNIPKINIILVTIILKGYKEEKKGWGYCTSSHPIVITFPIKILEKLIDNSNLDDDNKILEYNENQKNYKYLVCSSNEIDSKNSNTFFLSLVRVFGYLFIINRFLLNEVIQDCYEQYFCDPVSFSLSNFHAAFILIFNEQNYFDSIRKMYYNSQLEDIFVKGIIKSIIDNRYVDCDEDDDEEQIIFSKKDETYQEKLEIDIKSLIDEASSNLDNAEKAQEIRNSNSEQEDDEKSKESDKSDDDKESQINDDGKTDSDDDTNQADNDRENNSDDQEPPVGQSSQVTEKEKLPAKSNQNCKTGKSKFKKKKNSKRSKSKNKKDKTKQKKGDKRESEKEVEEEVEDEAKNEKEIEKEVEEKSQSGIESENPPEGKISFDDTKYFLLAHLYHNAEDEYHKFMFPNEKIPKKRVKKLLCERSLLPEKEDYINANIVSMQQVDQHIKIDFDNEENKLVLTVLDKDKSKFPIFSKSLLFKKLSQKKSFLYQEDEKENDKEVESTLIDCLNNNKILYAFVRDRITTFNSIAFPIQYELRKTLFLSVDPNLRLIMEIRDQSSNKTSLLITTDDAEKDDYRIVKEDDGIYLIFNPMLMEVKNSILFKTKVDQKFLFEDKKYINVDSIIVYWEFNKSKIDFLNMSRIPKIEVSTKTDLHRFHPYSIICKSFRNEDQDYVQEIYIITTAATREQNSEDKKYKFILH